MEGGFYPLNVRAGKPSSSSLSVKSVFHSGEPMLSLLVSRQSWLVVIQVFQQNIQVALGQGQGSSSLGFDASAKC